MQDADDDHDRQREIYLGALAHLQIRHADAAQGYETGACRAGVELTPVLEDLALRHRDQSREISLLLLAHGLEPDPDGSWLAFVHQTVMAVRSLTGALGAEVLPGVLEGERRILGLYESAVEDPGCPEGDRAVLHAQMHAVSAGISRLARLSEELARTG